MQGLLGMERGNKLTKDYAPSNIPWIVHGLSYCLLALHTGGIELLLATDPLPVLTQPMVNCKIAFGALSEHDEANLWKTTAPQFCKSHFLLY